MEEQEPFLIFPDLVWELILDNLQDSRDIQNVFAAFPRLGECIRLQSKKAVWLFDQAILYLATWNDSLDWNDFKSLRHTCKRWSIAVDKIFQEDLNLNNYIEEGSSCQVACYWDGNDRRSMSLNWFQTDNYFDSVDDINNFMEETESHERNGRNPFLTKAVSINYSYKITDDELINIAHDVVNRREAKERLLEFDNFVSNLLNSFGVHIWYFELTVGCNCNCEGDVYNFLVNCLRLLPNLRCLGVIGKDAKFTYITFSKYDDLFKNSAELPTIPYLKTLKLITGEARLCKEKLEGRYNQQILRANVYLRPPYDFYPNLKELELTPSYGLLDENTLKRYEFPRFLTTRRLGGGDFHYYIKDHILSTLKRIPLIKSLDLGDCIRYRVVETGNFSIADDSVPSLQFLKIHDSFFLRYNFLLCFPSLRQLIIVADARPFVLDNSVKSVVKIREQIATGRMYDSNIWEILEELRAIYIIVNGQEEDGSDSYDYQFRREDYDRLKKAGMGAPFCNRVGYHPLRQDCIEFLRANAGADAI